MKTIIVAYVNVSGITPTKAKEKMEQLKKSIIEQMPEASVITVPIKTGDTRIECLSPTTVAGETFKSMIDGMEKMFDNAEKTFSEFSKRMDKAFEAFTKS